MLIYKWALLYLPIEESKSEQIGAKRDWKRMSGISQRWSV